MPMFRLLMGMHLEADSQGRERTYRQGDVFESKGNLLALNGGGGMTPKFEQIQQAYAPNTAPQPFSPTQREPLIDMSDSALLDEMRKRGLLSSEVKPDVVVPKATIAHPDPVRFPSLSGKPAPKTKAEFTQLISSLSLKELQNLADDEEIDVPADAKTKDQVMKAILSSFKV